MSQSSRQFQVELDKLIRRYCLEADLTIGDALSILMLTALDLRDLMKAALQNDPDNEDL